MRLLRFILAFALVPMFGWTQAVAAEAEPMVNQYLTSGKLAAGEKALTAHLKNNAGDDQARFGLGMLQFVQAVEHLGQSWHTYGLLSQRNLNMPFFRMPLPQNPDPNEVSYEDVRKVIQGVVVRLDRAEKTLASIKSRDLKLSVPFALVRLDLNGDGKAASDEALWRVFARFAQSTDFQTLDDSDDSELQKQAEAFRINFDIGDVHWLRGYCHLLMGLAEIALAHDGQRLFELTGQLFFDKPKIAHSFLLRSEEHVPLQPFDLVRIFDAVAFLHLVQLKVKEPERMKLAHEHLRSVIEQSRQSWKHILAETDNDREWIPAPNQQTVVAGVSVSEEMVQQWQKFLDEGDDILMGKKLVPFWRGDKPQGVNLRRVFLEPRDFDLVLWVQGSAAAPYLDKGPMSSGETWETFQRIFGGNFIGFALWFN